MKFPIELAAISALLSSFAAITQAQEATTVTDASNLPSLTLGNGLPTETTGLYISYSSTITLATSGAVETENGNRTGTDGIPYTTTSDSFTLLVGSQGVISTLTANETTLTGNATKTATTSSVQPTNTRPCNGYPEFCERKYGNITNVAAHNSPFVREGNIASNQNLPVTIQLNDGVRARELTCLSENIILAVTNTYISLTCSSIPDTPHQRHFPSVPLIL